MFLVLLDAKPGSKATNPDPKGAVGAAVSCWIDFKDEDGAVALARYYVEANGWRVTAVEEVTQVEEGDMRTKSGVKFFREALEDGWCLHFGMYEGD